MNYQLVIADAIRQILFRSVDAATTTAAEAGFGFLSFFPAAVATATAWASSTTADAAVDVTTATTAVAAGSGLSSFCAAVATATAADAAVDAAASHNLLPFSTYVFGGSCQTDPLKLWSKEYHYFIYIR